jgi:hypothetical protein
MKNCKRCGEPFEPKNSQMLFHTQECKNRWHDDHRNDRDRGRCAHPDGCERPARKAGWCEMHYQRILAHGEPGPANKLTLWGEPKAPECSVEGCAIAPRASGMCSRHYKRVQTTGEAGPAGRLRRILPAEVRRYTKSEMHRFHRYGLTAEGFADLLARQGGRCYVCGTDAPGGNGWSVDHCHETNVVRFIACNPCNAALGLVKEDPRIAKRLYEVTLECQQLRLVT